MHRPAWQNMDTPPGHEGDAELRHGGHRPHLEPSLGLGAHSFSSFSTLEPGGAGAFSSPAPVAPSTPAAAAPAGPELAGTSGDAEEAAAAAAEPQPPLPAYYALGGGSTGSGSMDNSSHTRAVVPFFGTAGFQTLPAAASGNTRCFANPADERRLQHLAIGQPAPAVPPPPLLLPPRLCADERTSGGGGGASGKEQPPSPAAAALSPVPSSPAADDPRVTPPRARAPTAQGAAPPSAPLRSEAESGGACTCRS